MWVFGQLLRMKIFDPILLRVLATLGALLCGIATAHAQTYPSKPITLVNPWAPGGASDIIARPIMQKLAKMLGQPVIIENKAGANGTIGATFAAKAPNDGYTLFFSHVGPMAISPALQRVQYDPVKDFQPVTQLVSGPLVLVVRPDLPIANITEFIAYAKTHPGKLTYGSVGTGSTTHLAGEMLSLMTGVQLLHIPYKGNAQVITDMIGGQIDAAFINVAAAIPFFKPEKLRPLAVTTLKRSTTLPKLPPIADTLPGYEVNSWYGIMVPAGTPRPIIDRLYAELAVILKSPDIVEQMKQGGLSIVGSTPAQYALKLREDIVRWAKLIKATGVTAEN